MVFKITHLKAFHGIKGRTCRGFSSVFCCLLWACSCFWGLVLWVRNKGHSFVYTSFPCNMPEVLYTRIESAGSSILLSITTDHCCFCFSWIFDMEEWRKCYRKGPSGWMSGSLSPSKNWNPSGVDSHHPLKAFTGPHGLCWSTRTWIVLTFADPLWLHWSTLTILVPTDTGLYWPHGPC